MNKQQRDDMVISMINQWMTHREINKESGVPIATISDIRKRYGMAVAEEDDSLEAILLKLQSKGIHLNLEKNGTILVHKPRVVEPYQWWDKNNVLVIGDLHSPYDLDEYLYFCRGMQEQFNCGTVIYIGDIADFHSIMYHEKIPEELNPQGEMSMARKKLADWYYTFPEATVLLWNHDSLVYRKAQTAWLLREFIRDEHEIFGAPDTYKFLHEIEIDWVLYTHWSHWNAMEKCVKLWMNLVQWHLHTAAGVRRWKTRKWQIFGMQVWTGINYKKKVFDYAKSNAVDPVLWCWVVLNGWELPIFIPMNT